jgi:RND family efflux transporter MFP subunit
MWRVGGVVALAAAVGAGVAWQRGIGASGGPGTAAQAAGVAASAASAVPLIFRANEVVRPTLASLGDSITFSGPLVAPGSAVLRAKAAGTLLTLAVAEGDRVTAGQAVGRIDMADLASRIAERNANLASAQATLVQAERTHASNERLAAQGFISGIALENSRATLDTARAGLGAAQASLDTTRVAQRDAALLAPIAGIVAKRHVLPGEKVAIEQQVLTLVDLRKLELAGSVGTHEVARLRPGQPVALQVEGVAQPVAARLVRIAPAAEAGTRSIGVTVAVDNPGEVLRAGQYALARVDLPDPQQRLVLPLGAILRNAGQDTVWTLEQGALVRRAVTLGRRDDAGGRVEVLQGLTPQSQVLGARFDNLREGTRASVLPAGAGSATPEAAGTAVASASAVPAR